MPQRPLAPPSVRERVGGPWAVSFRAFLIAAGLLTAMSLLTAAGLRIGPYDDVADEPRVLATLIAVLAVWTLLLDRVILRNRAKHPAPVWVVFAVSGMMGLLRIAVLAAFAYSESRDAVPPLDAVITTVPAFAISALLLPAVAYVSATHVWYSGERERLVALAAEKETERIRAVGAVGALRDVALVAVQRDVATARRVVEDTTSDPVVVADALLAAARTGVRPAAHALIKRDASSVRRTTLRDAARAEVLRAPLPLLVPMLGFPILTAPRLYVQIDGLTAMVSSVVGSLGILVVFLVGRQAIRRRPMSALSIVMAACILAAIPVAATVNLLSTVRSPIGITISFIFVIFALVIVSTMARVVDASSEAALAELREPVLAAEIDRIAADRARDALLRDIGSHLHGTVQTGLVAASYAIRDAIEREDDEALAKAVEQARAAVAQRIDPAPGGAQPTEDSRATIDDEWRGLLDVTWTGARADGRAAATVTGVVRECLANAVVHGHASAATVDIAADDGDVVVAVEDNGIGPQAGPPGYGSAVLDDATGGRWSIEPRTGGGTRIVARIRAT